MRERGMRINLNQRYSLYLKMKAKKHNPKKPPVTTHTPLTRGTAYLTDIGMTGPLDSVIGFNPRTVLPRFVNALPTRFEVGEGPVLFNAVQIDIDPATGRALAIERIQRVVEV